jgi:hypothetical protein
MELPIGVMDVCVHLGSNRRCLVVAVRPDGTAACVFEDDRAFVCRVDDLVPYRHPAFDEALGRTGRAGRSPGPGGPE